MAREGLFVLICAGVFAGHTIAGDSADEAQGRVSAQLAVQKALREGRDQLQRGNYQGAVYLLEGQIARANANTDYLNALCDAYRGYIGDLQKAGRLAEVPKYRERLEILDPAACLQQKGAPTAVAAPAPRTARIDVQPAPEAAKQGTDKVRAKLEDDYDPFEPANRADAVPSPNLTRAEEEYSARRYESANRLFSQAAHDGEALPAACREHWGYCRLVGVAEALRRPAEIGPATELEREVRRAMAMTPKLGPFGQDLLRKIDERQRGGGSAPRPEEANGGEVRHTPAQAGSWAMAESANFRILHSQTREVAERVARAAEAARSAMLQKWFGDASGPWNPRCDIVLHATAQDYGQATGVPVGSPGHSTIKSEGERVVSRRIDLHCDDANMLIGVLPHETTHVVLAGHFGTYPVPRWADEGMAVLAEPRERIERHLHNLPKHRDDRHLFGTGQLMKLNDYPDPRYIGPFYAQSVSLVEFLSERSGPRVFASFLKDGLAHGYEPALQRHYKVQNFAELEQLWMQHAFGGATASASGK